MPSEFLTALCSSARNERIPEDCDFFEGLIGGWTLRGTTIWKKPNRDE